MPELTASAILSHVGAKTFDALFSEVVKKLFNKPEEAAPGKLRAAHLKEHCERTFQRCTKIKTLLSCDEPVDLLQQYVTTRFRSKRRGKEKIVDDYDAIKEIEEKRRATVVGTAGCGKTIFMRYLWISLFAGSNPHIPIFVELRRLNSMSTLDMESFIFHSIVPTNEKIDILSFQSWIEQGRFAFILDGFDEIAADKREKVQEQILRLCARTQKNIIIVSGRPDDRFESWQEFSIFRVEPLDKQQVIQLINKIEFDLSVKRKFIEAIDKGLYVKHKDFLSSPLLAGMMLLTFQHYAEIPEKIHVFYELAYATLFSRHDALKEAFKREKYTRLSIDIFKRQLSCFCIITYKDEKFSFNEAELLEYIRKSALLSDITFDAEDFMKDLLESVCILQQDGLEIGFSHRSFQEYFAAVYLVNMPQEKLSILLPQLARRGTDSVFTMMNDMNHDLFKSVYVIPMITKAKRAIRTIGVNPSAVGIALAYKLNVIVTAFLHPGREIAFRVSVGDREAWTFRGVSMTLYPEYFGETKGKMPEYLAQDHRIENLLLDDSLRGLVNNRNVILRNPITSDDALSETQRSNILDLFEKSGYAAWLRDTEACFRRLCAEIPRVHRRRTRDLKAVLHL